MAINATSVFLDNLPDRRAHWQERARHRRAVHRDVAVFRVDGRRCVVDGAARRARRFDGEIRRDLRVMRTAARRLTR